MDFLDWFGVGLMLSGISWLLSLLVYWLSGSFEYDLKFKYVKQLFKPKQYVFINDEWRVS